MNDLTDYLDEDYVPKNQQYAVFSYFVNHKNNKDVAFMYKIKGVYKTLELARSAVSRLNDDAKKFHVFIVEVGKWNGGYTDDGLMNLKNDKDVVYANSTLNSIMKERKAELQKAEDEHRKRMEVNRHISSVYASLKKSLQLLEAMNFIKIDYPESKKLQEREELKSQERYKLRKDIEKLRKFHKECVELEIQEFSFLKDISELETKVTKEHVESETDSVKKSVLVQKLNLQNVYDKILDDNGGKFSNLEGMCIKILEDLHVYKNYIENYEESLNTSKEDIKYQIKELERKLEEVEDNIEENEFNYDQIYKLKPFEIL